MTDDIVGRDDGCNEGSKDLQSFQHCRDPGKVFLRFYLQALAERRAQVGVE